jgi:uncharacterized protein DUF6484
VKLPQPSPLLERVLSPEGGAPSVRVGLLVDAAGGALRVDFAGNTDGPLTARSMVPIGPELLRDAPGRRREVVLLFEDGDPRRPIIAGLLEPALATPGLDAALDATARPGAAAPSAAGSAELPEGLPAVATVDGRRVAIEGADEVVLRCGDASITLRRNGKVIVRGLYVETHAAGTNRIKGGSVKIN